MIVAVDKTVKTNSFGRPNCIAPNRDLRFLDDGSVKGKGFQRYPRSICRSRLAQMASL